MVLQPTGQGEAGIDRPQSWPSLTAGPFSPVNGTRILTPFRQVKIDPPARGRCSRSVVSRHPPEVSVFEPVAVALQADDLGVMHESVDHGPRHDSVTEHLAPSTWKWHTFPGSDLCC